MRHQSILHVEDDDAAALLVQIALEELGAPVTCHRVSSVDQALEFLAGGEQDRAQDLSLILLDLNMPLRSGHDVLTAISEAKRFSHIRVVVFTASAFVSDRAKSLSMGAFDYFRKPTDYDEYLDTIRKVLTMLPEKRSIGRKPIPAG